MTPKQSIGYIRNKSYFPRDGGGFVKGLYPTKRRPLTTRLAYDLNGTQDQNGIGWGKCFKLYVFDTTHWIFIAKYFAVGRTALITEC